jgi:hypothetical protein
MNEKKKKKPLAPLLFSFQELKKVIKTFKIVKNISKMKTHTPSPL